MLFMPESPLWLMSKYGRSSQVVDALRKLRSDSSDIETELKEMEDNADKSKENSGFSMGQLARPDIYKPFIIANALMFFQQFSGINAVLFYLKTIFEDSGSSMDPMVSTCIVCAAMVIATIGGGLITDRLGRKVLLLASGVGHVVTLGVMGYYYYQKMHSGSDTTTVTTIASVMVEQSAESVGGGGGASLGWLPVVCLVVFVVSFSLGFGPIPWMIVAEITPSHAIGAVSATGTAFNWLCAFIVTKQFESIQKSLQSYGAFWMFAAIQVVAVLFTIFFVPETKGRSLEEMSRIFMGQSAEDQSTDMSKGSLPKYSVNKDVTTV